MRCFVYCDLIYDDDWDWIEIKALKPILLNKTFDFKNNIAEKNTKSSRFLLIFEFKNKIAKKTTKSSKI